MSLASLGSPASVLQRWTCKVPERRRVACD